MQIVVTKEKQPSSLHQYLTNSLIVRFSAFSPFCFIASHKPCHLFPIVSLSLFQLTLESIRQIHLLSKRTISSACQTVCSGRIRCTPHRTADQGTATMSGFLHLHCEEPVPNRHVYAATQDSCPAAVSAIGIKRTGNLCTIFIFLPESAFAGHRDRYQE